MLSFLLAVLPLCVFSESLRDSRATEQFLLFRETYHKEYSSAEDAEYRFRVFRVVLDTIERHNAGSHGWRMGVNQFSDLTDSEFAFKMHGLSSRVSPPPSPVPSDPVPPSVDWVSLGMVNGVQNVGKCTGAAYAFASASAIEAAHAIATNTHLNLSRQQIIDCSKDWGTAGCEDGAYFAAYSYAAHSGVCNSTDYPYTGVFSPCQSCSPAIKIKDQKGCQSLSQSNLTAFLAQRPVTTMLHAASIRHYSSGIFNGSCQGESDTLVLLVGYGAEADTLFYRAQMSWGTGWGEKGYMRLKRDDQGLGLCQLTEFCAFPRLK